MSTVLLLFFSVIATSTTVLAQQDFGEQYKLLRNAGTTDCLCIEQSDDYMNNALTMNNCSDSGYYQRISTYTYLYEYGGIVLNGILQFWSSGKVLDVDDAGSIEGGLPGRQILRWELHGGANQRWKFEEIGNYTRIKNLLTGHYLAYDPNWESTGTAQVIQKADDVTDHFQQWMYGTDLCAESRVLLGEEARDGILKGLETAYKNVCNV